MAKYHTECHEAMKVSKFVLHHAECGSDTYSTEWDSVSLCQVTHENKINISIFQSFIMASVVQWYCMLGCGLRDAGLNPICNKVL